MRVLLAQLPLPSPIQEPDDPNQPLAAGFLLCHARQVGALAGVEAAILPAAVAGVVGDRALLRACLDFRPELVGLSVYLWNVDRTLWLARGLKEQLPGVRIVLGGPEVTLDNTRLHQAAGWDFLAVGEGEQTFAALLRWWQAGQRWEELPLPGLVARRELAAPGLRPAAVQVGPPALPLERLDGLRPYQEGWLPVPVGQEALIETTRGCLHRCKYCYYPKHHPHLTTLSPEALREQVRFVRDQGAAGLYLLDPTLTDRPALPELLDLLTEEGRGLQLFGELRGEAITPELAARLARAGFREVEVGLQSTNPRALRQVGRRGRPRQVAAGVRLLQEVGIRSTLDLIVGLPADTPATLRNSLTFVYEEELVQHVQVFTLSLLPGTQLRERAARLGLEHAPDPPYHVRQTPDLTPADLAAALALAEELYETELDALPLPLLADLPGTGARSELDEPVAAAPRAAHTLWCQVADPLAEATRIGQRAAAHLRVEPFATLAIVLETPGPFPHDAYDRIYQELEPWTQRYLDLLHNRQAVRRSWSCQVVTLLPWSARRRTPRSWLEDALHLAAPVWRLPPCPAAELGPLLQAARPELALWETVLVTELVGLTPSDRTAWLRELAWQLEDAEQLQFADPTLQQGWAEVHAED